MKSSLVVFVFIALAAFCWGTYAPVLQLGKKAMIEKPAAATDEAAPAAPAAITGGKLAIPMFQFLCVGLAYFVIAVLVPGIWLALRGEKGHWSVMGSVWSLAAGAAGAVGALGMILALGQGGKPIYVAPLVFGCAPVVNTFYTIITTKNFKLSPFFIAGLLLVIAGAVTVLVFRPGHHGPAGEILPAAALFMVGCYVALTALSWGVYGPVLHQGQSKMAGSRLRPLICVGVAYFLIAVLIPAAMLMQSGMPAWNVSGTIWSLGGGTAGAVGALGIIMAFNFGGRPIYVMPLVFGCAPVINTFTSMLTSKDPIDAISPIFYAGLIVVAVGAVCVLVFAPKGGHGPKPAAPQPDKKSAEPVKS
ncbi:MAG: hypothetical protein AB7O62_15345 [Pirellulales bacterium]